MKSFDVYFRRSIRTDPDWSLHYVNYEELKNKLDAYSKRRVSLRKVMGGNVGLSEEDVSLAAFLYKSDHAEILIDGSESNTGYFQYNDGNLKAGTSSAPTIKPEEAMLRVSNMERAEFCNILDTEMSKAASFYGTQLVHLAKSIAKLKDVTPSDHGSTLTGKPVVSNRDQYEKTGNEIMETLAFVVGA